MRPPDDVSGGTLRVRRWTHPYYPLVAAASNRTAGTVAILYQLHERNAGPIAGVAINPVEERFRSPSANSKEENAMKTKTFVLAGVALFAFGVDPAMAGPCTTEIDALAKSFAAKDAGAGPTAGASGRTQSGVGPRNQHPPTAAMSQATQGQATSPEDVRRQTAGQPPAAQQGTAAQHPPTAAMSEATQGQTAPATTGQHPPTAAMSEATRGQAPRRAVPTMPAKRASRSVRHERSISRARKPNAWRPWDRPNSSRRRVEHNGRICGI